MSPRHFHVFCNEPREPSSNIRPAFSALAKTRLSSDHNRREDYTFDCPARATVVLVVVVREYVGGRKVVPLIRGDTAKC